ncbi:hypothetical protein DXG01_004458 [Tephrocybe rancida]|nr:hypothetical protein DXG01_004458 [Tephrocybe rancida]
MFSEQMILDHSVFDMGVDASFVIDQPEAVSFYFFSYLSHLRLAFATAPLQYTTLRALPPHLAIVPRFIIPTLHCLLILIRLATLLIVLHRSSQDTYGAPINTLAQVDQVVELLYAKTVKIMYN